MRRTTVEMGSETGGWRPLGKGLEERTFQDTRWLWNWGR